MDQEPLLNGKYKILRKIEKKVNNKIQVLVLIHKEYITKKYNCNKSEYIADSIY